MSRDIKNITISKDMNNHLTRKYIWRLYTVYLCIDSFFFFKQKSFSIIT